jgi:hypothetical protein
MVEVIETPRRCELSAPLVKDHTTAAPAHCIQLQKAAAVHFVIEFGNHPCILSSFGGRIVANRRLAKLQALIEVVFEHEFGARRPQGKWKRSEA